MDHIGGSNRTLVPLVAPRESAMPPRATLLPMPHDLGTEMRLRNAEPFPESVEKGSQYGEVDAVMIDADIYGWASHVASGVRLRGDQRPGLQSSADELERSLDAFPQDARPYYERLLRIARLALAAHP